MTESAQRRQDLLSQTRRTYSDKSTIPAIHPRYGNIYHTLYETNTSKEETKHNSKHLFHIRVIIAILLFILYAGMDLQDITIGTYNSEQVVDAITENIQVVNVWNSW